MHRHSGTGRHTPAPVHFGPARRSATSKRSPLPRHTPATPNAPAAAPDPPEPPDLLDQHPAQAPRTRTTNLISDCWRQHLTAHGPANELLLAFQNQHRLPARFNEILAEVADYSRLVQTQESQQISGALGVLTILGLPLGTALGILQVLGDDSLSHLLIALTLSVAATAAVLTTRYGRLVLSSLRGGLGKR
ncbi:hypothetical protein [Streptomyces sp. TE5632]